MLYIFPEVTEEFDSPLSTERLFADFLFSKLCTEKKSLRLETFPFILCYNQTIITEPKAAAMIYACICIRTAMYLGLFSKSTAMK